MYDALLAIRGWGVAEFREFSPALQQAARVALYAERVAPMLGGHRAVLAAPMAGRSMRGKGDLFAAKTNSTRAVAILEALLYGD